MISTRISHGGAAAIEQPALGSCVTPHLSCSTHLLVTGWADTSCCCCCSEPHPYTWHNWVMSPGWPCLLPACGISASLHMTRSWRHLSWPWVNICLSARKDVVQALVLLVAGLAVLNQRCRLSGPKSIESVPIFTSCPYNSPVDRNLPVCCYWFTALVL